MTTYPKYHAENVRHPAIDGEIEALQAKLAAWRAEGVLVATDAGTHSGPSSFELRAHLDGSWMLAEKHGGSVVQRRRIERVGAGAMLDDLTPGVVRWSSAAEDRMHDESRAANKRISELRAQRAQLLAEANEEIVRAGSR